MGKDRFPKQTGCFMHWQKHQAAGWRLTTTTVWEDGGGEMAGGGGMECIQPKIIPFLGMERNDLLAAHCPHFNLRYLKTLQGITEASSKAHSQRSCPVCCQWEESAFVIGYGPRSPALL